MGEKLSDTLENFTKIQWEDLAKYARQQVLLIDKIKTLEAEVEHLETVFSELGIAFDDLKRMKEAEVAILKARNLEYEEQAGQMITEVKRLTELLENNPKQDKWENFNQYKTIENYTEQLTKLGDRILMAEDRLVKAQELVAKLRSEAKGLESAFNERTKNGREWNYCDQDRYEMRAEQKLSNRIADELEKALGVTGGSSP